MEVKGEIMDIWQKMFEKSKALYQPQEVSDFVYAR
ncbi:MAG: cytidine deaminase, partial [Streptococcus salivarius]